MAKENSFSNIEPLNTPTEITRPIAPDTLTDAQAAIWDTTVSALSADWFTPEALPLLAEYCKHVASSNSMAAAINECEQSPNYADKDWLAMYNRLTAMREREVRSMSSLATRLRITLQSTRSSHSTKPNQDEALPWDDVE